MHIDANQEELQIKVVFSSLCQGMPKGFRHRDAFLLLIFIIIAIIIIVITIAFHLTLVKGYINDKTNKKVKVYDWVYLHLIKNKISKTTI